MCGRTSLANLPEHLKPFLGRYRIRDTPPWYSPRHNIAPSQDQMVIVERDGEREARSMRWGLVPFFASDPGVGNMMINARAETVATKPAYRQAFMKRRGLLVVDSYYEWRKNTSGPKTPFRFHLPDNAPFTLAAIWERWGRGDASIDTFSVVTTAASGAASQVHHRMPVVIPESVADRWLDSASPQVILDEIIAGTGTLLLKYAVSSAVNNPANDDEVCWGSAEVD
jgi:putative SOS response-associated peptidase YedK